MAKKDIASLINGIVGGEARQEQTQQTSDRSELSTSTVEALQISPELEEKLNAVRRAKVGRPRGSTTAKPREHRATFIVSEDIIYKLKYISLMDSRLLKDVVSDALLSAIAQWEEENGTIEVKPKKA